MEDANGDPLSIPVTSDVQVYSSLSSAIPKNEEETAEGWRDDLRRFQQDRWTFEARFETDGLRPLSVEFAADLWCGSEYSSE
jgi:hypothetical protein